MTSRTALLLILVSLVLPCAAAPRFQGLVAHQEDLAGCESGCTPRVGVTSIIAIDQDRTTATRLTPSEREAAQWMINGRGVSATAFPSLNQYFAVRNEKASSTNTRGAMLDGSRDCTAALDGTRQEFTVLGHEMVSGYRTIKMKHQRASSIIWRAPDLGCFVLQTEDRFPGPQGGPVQIMRKRTTSLTLGPPPTEYFSFPAHWQHESPIAVWTARIQQRMKGDALARELTNLQNNMAMRKLQEMWDAKSEKLDLHRPL